MLPRVLATRYVSPLREGGSLPGLVEADDLGTYVVKFRGAGQGTKALVAEVIVGELGRQLGLPIPALAAIELTAAIGRYEPDQEVQDLLTASVGLNLAIDFLPGSFGFDGRTEVPDPAQAAAILWLDALTANIDRTWRNPNLLLWHRQLWCIDHGAALYFHHAWDRSSPERFAAQAFDASTHILSGYAAGVAEADARLRPALTGELLEGVLADVPDEWLDPAPGAQGPDALRRRYVDYLQARLATPGAWLPEAA